MMDIESHTIIYLREMLSTGVAEDASISAFLSCWASRMTRHFPAVHMTWGTNNKLSTLTGYHTLIDKTWHPLLTAMLSRIIKDEGRHFSFYFNQARRMLQDPAEAASLLASFWSTV
jgi:hypothetical protein